MGTIILAALAALALGGGTATAAKLITSKDIKNGTIKLADLSAGAKKSLKGRRGPAGPAGMPGAPGAPGARGPAGYSTGVVTADTAIFLDDGSEGWGAWLDNTGSPFTTYLVTEVYCASGDVWYDYVAVAAHHADGWGVTCDAGDTMVSGGWWLSDTAPTAAAVSARAHRAPTSQRLSKATARAALKR